MLVARTSRLNITIQRHRRHKHVLGLLGSRSQRLTVKVNTMLTRGEQGHGVHLHQAADGHPVPQRRLEVLNSENSRHYHQDQVEQNYDGWRSMVIYIMVARPGG